MVITFSLEKPLNHLLNTKYIYTFRIKKRKRIGKNWFNDGRLKKKIGNCYISLRDAYDYYLITDKERPVFFIGSKYTVFSQFLRPYHKNSGFDSIDEWIDAIIKLNKGKIPLTGYIYLVHNLD